MSSRQSYLDYVSNKSHMKAYSRYQQKYAKTIRESDKVLISIVKRLIADDTLTGKRPALLDLGCSTGNLLLHLKHALPQLALFGGDIVLDIVAECQRNPELAGIQFAEMNMLSLSQDRQFDLVVTNAALMFFSEAEFEQALSNIASVVRPGGWYVAFDLFHPFEQEIAVFEKSQSFPQGLEFHFRSYRTVKATLQKAGFSAPTFAPFSIAIDLEKPQDPANLNSYTVRSGDGSRMSFRGTLFQPWCHLTARKS